MPTQPLHRSLPHRRSLMPNSTFSISRPAFCTSLAAILQGVALASALAQAPPTSQEKTTAAQEDKKSLATKVQQAPSAAPITKIPAGAQSQEDKAAAVDKVQQTPSAPPITKVPTRRQSVTQNPPKAGV